MLADATIAAIVLAGIVMMLLGRRRPRVAAAMVVAALALPGCPGLLPVLVRAAQIGQWIAGVIDAAERAADLWLATSPDPALEAKVRAAVSRCRLALRALDEAVLAVQAGKDADIEAAKGHVSEAYAALYDLLEGVGALSATGELGAAAGGGALPTPGEVEGAL